jgi:uncharacterized repeat protein (TIGR03803 family)
MVLFALMGVLSSVFRIIVILLSGLIAATQFSSLHFSPARCVAVSLVAGMVIFTILAEVFDKKQKAKNDEKRLRRFKEVAELIRAEAASPPPATVLVSSGAQELGMGQDDPRIYLEIKESDPPAINHTPLLLWTTAAIGLPAQTFTVLTSLNGSTDSAPYGELVQASNALFFGTTAYGGNNVDGTIFVITQTGNFAQVYSFANTDGTHPMAGLVEGPLDSNGHGVLYGTTSAGGTNGGGTVFTFTTDFGFTTIYNFCSASGCTDGGGPHAKLVQGTDGNFYGTTDYGGANYGCSVIDGCGTVFKITPGGTLTTLYSFCSLSNCQDGYGPISPLVQATDGNFYGTADMGGGANKACRSAGCGTIFKITPNGTLTTLHHFDGTDGQNPSAGLVQGNNGTFYGITYYGGTNGDGTVFSITANGTFTTLHSFDATDGAHPLAVLARATNENLYGTTSDSGANGVGTIFEITPSGTLTTLYNFCSQTSCTDGGFPLGGLLLSTDGNFYGTTTSGGTNDRGTVFSLSVGLRRFVETQPASGVVGAAVNILGNNLTGATSVTFNGTAAAFTVDSHSLITTTVPAGATSGKVQVTVRGDTLSSNVPFRVN